MLYEFAMTPDLFGSDFLDTKDAGGTILVEILRGLADYGLLANLHKDRWIRHVEERVNSLSPELKHKVFDCLSVLNDRHRLVRHPKSITGNPKSNNDWLKVALDSHDKVPFHAIILSQELMENFEGECSEFLEFSESLDSSQWRDCKKQTWALTKSPADYRSNLAPVLRYARSLALVDPYLNLEKSRYFNTVEICSNLLGYRRGDDKLSGRIDIHTDVKHLHPDRSINNYLADWRELLQPLINEDKHSFRIFLWEAEPGQESMHDRYIFTDQCGLLIPGGLDCRTHSHPNSTDWSLVDDNDRRKRWEDYDPSTSPFNLLARAEI